MRVTQVSLLLIAVIVMSGFALLIDQSLRDLSRETFQATEEALIDVAQMLSAVVEADLEQGGIQTDVMERAMPIALARRFDALIYDLQKTRMGCHIYITDEEGMVIYDSDGGKQVGENILRMRDVALTLMGLYGARSTRLDATDESSSVLHIAAPIRHEGKVIGVLTVRKPKADQWPIIESRRNKVILSSALIGVGILGFVIAVLYWVMRPISLLTDYTRKVAEGKRPEAPKLGGGLEVNTLGAALETMREELEGRDYATSYVQTLTHELKSPLAAIRGAAELLQEPTMPEADRQRFLQNLCRESDRAERLLRQMLRLSELERKKALQDHQELDLRECVDAAVAECQSHAEGQQVKIECEVPSGPVTVQGEATLLRRALVNLIENAVDFSPSGGEVEVMLAGGAGAAEIQVRDHGPGIPDYAAARLFERFYSLKNQQTGHKGTGLGLCFVKEAAELHHGTVELRNAEGGGAVAVLTIGR